MKLTPFLSQLFVVLAFVGLAAFANAATTSDAEAVIVEGAETIAEYLNPTGYKYGFKSSNGIERAEEYKTDGLVVGSYKFVDPEGAAVDVAYKAGAGIGFYPTGPHIHPAIIEAIELNLKNPPEPATRR